MRILNFEKRRKSANSKAGDKSVAPPRKLYGITRFDQPERGNHGWRVRIAHRKRMIGNRHFLDGTHGSATKSLKAAVAYRDSVLEKAPKVVKERAARPKPDLPQSGVKGVTYCEWTYPTKQGPKTYQYWRAVWLDPETGKRRGQKFSIQKYGNEGALKLAKKARKKALRKR